MVPPTSASWQREPGSRTALGSCCQLPLELFSVSVATEAAPSLGSLFLALQDYPEGPGQQQALLCKSCGLLVRLPRCSGWVFQGAGSRMFRAGHSSCPTLLLLSADQPCSPMSTKGIPKLSYKHRLDPPCQNKPNSRPSGI